MFAFVCLTHVILPNSYHNVSLFMSPFNLYRLEGELKDAEAWIIGKQGMLGELLPLPLKADDVNGLLQDIKV